MKNLTLICTLALVVVMSSSAIAQNTMSDSHMMAHTEKMDSKSMDQHMYDGLTADETTLAHDMFKHLSKGDRNFFKKQIHEKAMKSNMMGADKMGDNMGDHMGKMSATETRYDKIYKSLTDAEKVVVDKLIANCAKWCKDHSGKM